MEIIDNVISVLFLNKLNPETAGLVLALGAITLFIFFFRTEEWKGLSDFDKLILSGLVGYMLWTFLIAPISLALWILNSHFMPEPNSFEKIMSSTSFIFIFVSTLLILIPLKDHDFDKFHDIIGDIKSAIKILMLITLPIIIFFYLAFFFSIYRDKAWSITVSLLFLTEFMWVLWYLILRTINKDETLDFENILSADNKKRAIFIIGLFAVSAIGGILVGSYYSNPSITKSTNLERIEIPHLPVNREYGYLRANFIYNTTYEIRFGLVKWVNIESNYTIVQAYDSDNKSKKYEWNGTSIGLRGNDKTSVTIFESKEQNINRSFGVFSKKQLNTSQEWNIILNNTNTVKIELEELAFQNDEKLRLIGYLPDGISVSTLEREINQSNDFGIYHISIEPNEKKSLILYFAK